jgi:hypothetical protein
MDLNPIAESICGKSLAVVPVICVDVTKIKEIDVQTLTLQRDVLQEFYQQFLMRVPIGAHCLINEGLSGAFAHFMLNRFPMGDIEEFKGPPNDVIPSRLQVKLGRFGIRDHLVDMINKALQTVTSSRTDGPLNLLVEKESYFFELLISFHHRNFPKPHKDGATSKRIRHDHEVRILWDFHPRGRCLFLNKLLTTWDEHGIFVENCGIEVCCNEMCGNKPLESAANVNIHEKYFFHRGWDRRAIDDTCPLTTAVLDLRVNNGTVNELLGVMNSPDFCKELSQLMESYVTQSFEEFMGRGATLDDLKQNHKEMNKALSDQFTKVFPNAPSDPSRNDGGNHHTSTVSYFENIDGYVSLNRLFENANFN